MKKFLNIIFLLIFSFNNYALENVDECNEFINLAKENSDNKLNIRTSYEIDSLQILYDYSKAGYDIEPVFKRSESNRVFPESIFFGDSHEKYKDDFYEGDEIYSINGLLTSEMTDEEITNEISKAADRLTFALIWGGYNDDLLGTYPDIRSFNIASSLETILYPFDLEIKSIERIDSATSTYKTRYFAKVGYEVEGIENILHKIFSKVPEPSSENDLFFYCVFTNSQMEDTDISVPQIRPTNIVSMEGDSTSVYYELYASKELQNDEIYYYYTLIQAGDYISTFRSSFDFSTFPFDKQSLTFNFQDAAQDGYIYFAPQSESFKNTFVNLEIYDWTKTGYDAKLLSEPTSWGTTLSASYILDLERNSIYFVTKIFLPILIILGLSFSVMWIKPSELEARLTVSVVCFLALITYTFIIDKDLPKLAYLTVMDYIILISYLFAAIPTVESVFISKYQDYKRALYIDKTYRTILPILYFAISLFIVFFAIVSNLPNTKAFLN